MAEPIFIDVAVFIAVAAGSSAWARAPYSESELRSQETSDDAKVRELRNQEITQLRIALGRRSPANRRADLYMRLAEIYVEAYRADYLLEGRVHEKRLERGQEDRFIDHSHSRPNLAAGIKACNEILRLRIPDGGLQHLPCQAIEVGMIHSHDRLSSCSAHVYRLEKVGCCCTRHPWRAPAVHICGPGAMTLVGIVRLIERMQVQLVQAASWGMSGWGIGTCEPAALRLDTVDRQIAARPHNAW